MGACIAGSRTPNPRATRLRNLGSHAVYGFGVRLERFSGREIKTTGDGFVATFPSAISALRCAVPIREGMSVLGLAVRIRVHTGEVEVVDEDIHGLNVHAAARIHGPGRAVNDPRVGDHAISQMAAVRKFNERGAPRLKVNWPPSVKPKASQTSSSLSMEQPATFSTYGRSFESLPEAAGRPDGLPSWAAGDSPPGGVEVDGAGAAELQALISRAIALIARAG